MVMRGRYMGNNGNETPEDMEREANFVLFGLPPDEEVNLDDLDDIGIEEEFEDADDCGPGKVYNDEFCEDDDDWDGWGDDDDDDDWDDDDDEYYGEDDDEVF